ncbi:hypothetical protein ACIRS1_12175 [Kitasatospora sp. NPDC101176]|uniref:hypothetical protein n=1 Tax=Kitasatospora sp. NPDC101176 TaxID=3364099 RepID=UPI003826E380
MNGRQSSAWWLPVEGLVGVSAALLMTWTARFVHVDPMVRVGQVSGLAGLQLVLLLAMGGTVGLLLLVMRRWPVLPLQFGAAIFAGLSSGVLAAAVSLALRGTPWPLGGQGGDAGVLQGWAFNIIHGQPIDDTYPPLFPHLLGWYTRHFTDGDPGHALKIVSLVFIALLGPTAYVAWRLILPPLWALGIGVTASLPLADPYKPYTTIVLVGLLPVLAKLLQLIQRSQLLGRRRAAVLGAVVGAVLGLLFLLYSGWFVWSAAGLVLMGVVLLVRQWRTHGTPALVTALLLVGSAGAVFVSVSGFYLTRFLSSAGGAVDRYCYFDVYTEPSYFTMWGGDMPGGLGLGAWPQPGEIGGVGLFAVVLLVGAAAALVVGPRNSVVLATAAAAASAFLMRYWYASHMWKDQAVMLYPRTNQQLLYCFVVLTGLALFLGVERLLERRHRTVPREHPERPGRTPRRYALASLCALGLLIGMAGSSTGSRYMPEPAARIDSTGNLAHTAQVLRGLNGVCSPYADAAQCVDPVPPAVFDQAAKIRKDQENQQKPEYRVLSCQEGGSPYPHAPKPTPTTTKGAGRPETLLEALVRG